MFLLRLAFASLTCACAHAQAQDAMLAPEATFEQCLEAVIDCETPDAAPECGEPGFVPGACTEFVDYVAASDLAALLPPDWADELSRQRLLDLRYFAEERVKAPQGRALATDGIRRILDEMQSEAQAVPTLNWWGRFKEWVRSMLDHRETPRRAPFDIDVSERVLRAVAYALLGCAVLGLLALLVNELRAAGVLTAIGLRPPRRARAADVAASRSLGPADVLNAPLHEQPSFVLRLLVEALARARRLADRRSLTHRELEHAARLESQDDVQAFRALLRTAEATVYGNRKPSDAHLVSVVRDGLGLVERVAARPAVRP